jgi:hypothetical protein
MDKMADEAQTPLEKDLALIAVYDGEVKSWDF